MGESVEIYVDVSCEGSVGRGGWGCALEGGGKTLQLSGGFRRTTSNRVELRAIIEGLKALKKDGLAVTVFTDNKWLADMFNQGNVAKWRAKGWMRTPTHPIVHADLWNALMDQCAKHHVQIRVTPKECAEKSLTGITELAVCARKNADLPLDDGYENPRLPATENDGYDFFGDDCADVGVTNSSESER